MRRAAFAALIVALMMTSTCQAEIITDNFVFQNQSSNGNTISGSFTFDDSGSNPYVVSSFVVEGYGLTTLTDDEPALTFDGTSLTGSVAASGVYGPLDLEADGDFSPSASGATGTLSFSALFGGFLPVGGDSVSGAMTITPSVSAVPEPSSLALCGIAAVAGLAVARARRKRQA